MLTPDGNLFLTPDVDGNETIQTRMLSLPSFLWQYVNGALGELTYTDNWYAFGSMSPAEAAQVFLDALSNMTIFPMTGSIIPFCTNHLPTGILPCDGSQWDREDYPALYAALPLPLQITPDTFITPDLRDRFILGTGSRPPLVVGGEETHTLTIAEIPPHTHSLTGAFDSLTTVAVPDAPSAVPMPMSSGSTGGGMAHNNMPPFYVLRYGIVAV